MTTIQAVTVTVGTEQMVMGRPVALRATSLGLTVFVEVDGVPTPSTVLVIGTYLGFEGRYVDTFVDAESGLVVHLVVRE